MRKTVIALLCLLLMAAGTALAEDPGPEEIRVAGSLGSIYGVLRVPEGTAEGETVPLVILCHGFGGSLLGLQNYAQHFAEAGFAVCAFDFCGGGMYGNRSDGSMTEMSVLTEARDLNAVLDHCLADGRFGPVFLFGQSQGGFVAAYLAAQRPDDVAALVLEYPAFVIPDASVMRRRPDGSYPENGTQLGMPIGRIYDEDAASVRIFDVIGAYTGDVLILHGNLDFIVPLSYSERAKDVYPSAELVVLMGQTHGFSGRGLREAMERETAFLLAHTGE